MSTQKKKFAYFLSSHGFVKHEPVGSSGLARFPIWSGTFFHQDYNGRKLTICCDDAGYNWEKREHFPENALREEGFVSLDDKSGTHTKEWTQAGIL